MSGKLSWVVIVFSEVVTVMMLEGHSVAAGQRHRVTLHVVGAGEIGDAIVCGQIILGLILFLATLLARGSVVEPVNRLLLFHFYKNPEFVINKFSRKKVFKASNLTWELSSIILGQ